MFRVSIWANTIGKELWTLGNLITKFSELKQVHFEFNTFLLNLLKLFHYFRNIRSIMLKLERNTPKSY